MSSVGDCTRREGGGKEEGLSGREGLRWEGGEQFRVDREVDGVRGRGGGGGQVSRQSERVCKACSKTWKASTKPLRCGYQVQPFVTGSHLVYPSTPLPSNVNTCGSRSCQASVAHPPLQHANQVLTILLGYNSLA